MKFLGGLLIFGLLLGGLHYLGIIGTPSPTLDEEEIQYLMSLPVEPIHQSMSVSRAYKAIPHNQITYRSNKSVLNRAEAEYLEQVFSLVDLAVVERISLMHNIQRKGNRPIRLANYEQILKRILNVPVPPGLEYFHQQVVAAIMEEKQYYQELGEQSSISTVNQWHPLIRRPHRRLMASYQFLATRYPQESRRNQQAFFEHLCALDFI